MARTVWLAFLMLDLFAGCVWAQPASTKPHPDAACHMYGMICVNPFYQDTIVGFGMIRPRGSEGGLAPDREKISTLGISISFTTSDMLQRWRLSAMKKICVGDACTYYRKSCDESSCEYAYGNIMLSATDPAGHIRVVPATMVIDFTTPDALEMAEKNVFLVLGDSDRPPGPKGDNRFIPLSDLVATTDKGFPYCAQNSKERGC